jgi:hypothetical protein
MAGRWHAANFSIGKKWGDGAGAAEACVARARARACVVGGGGGGGVFVTHQKTDNIRYANLLKTAHLNWQLLETIALDRQL